MASSQNTSSNAWFALWTKPATETDRGSRWETLSYESEDSMPPLVPAATLAPATPSRWGPPATAKEPPAPRKLFGRSVGCSQHDGVYDEEGNHVLGRTVTEGGIPFSCTCPPKKLESTLDAEAPIFQSTAPPQPWGPHVVCDLQLFWESQQKRRRSEEHAEVIDHLVEFIYDNNADTLAEEFKQKMRTATSPKKLVVDIYQYRHANVNSPQDKSRWEAYTDSEGREWTNLQEFLHFHGHETMTPTGEDDVHWLVKKTDFLEKLAARFGAENFTASYKLECDRVDPNNDFFTNDATLRLHFWPNGVPKRR
jgi:hypothetical protein